MVSPTDGDDGSKNARPGTCATAASHSITEGAVAAAADTPQEASGASQGNVEKPSSITERVGFSQSKTELHPCGAAGGSRDDSVSLSAPSHGKGRVPLRRRLLEILRRHVNSQGDSWLSETFPASSSGAETSSSRLRKRLRREPSLLEGGEEQSSETVASRECRKSQADLGGYSSLCPADVRLPRRDADADAQKELAAEAKIPQEASAEILRR